MINYIAFRYRLNFGNLTFQKGNIQPLINRQRIFQRSLWINNFCSTCSSGVYRNTWQTGTTILTKVKPSDFQRLRVHVTTETIRQLEQPEPLPYPQQRDTILRSIFRECREVCFKPLFEVTRQLSESITPVIPIYGTDVKLLIQCSEYHRRTTA